MAEETKQMNKKMPVMDELGVGVEIGAVGPIVEIGAVGWRDATFCVSTDGGVGVTVAGRSGVGVTSPWQADNTIPRRRMKASFRIRFILLES